MQDLVGTPLSSQKAVLRDVPAGTPGRWCSSGQSLGGDV